MLDKRSAEADGARKKLLRQDIGSYADLAHGLLEHPSTDGADAAGQRLHASVQEAWGEWTSALARAEDTRTVEDLHAFRVATKRLRYRTELLDNVGPERMKTPLAWLETLQDALGTWHDRQLLQRAVAEAVGRTDVLLRELPHARVLLAELDAERRRPPRDVERILRLARVHPGLAEMARWSAVHGAPGAHAVPGAPDEDGDGSGKSEVNA